MFAEFISKYFIEPIAVDEGYNFINTTAYAVLILFFLWIYYKLFRKLKIDFDFKFFLTIIPFIILGSITRSFVDHGLYANSGISAYLLVSPMLYVLTAALYWISLIPSLLLRKKYPYWKTQSIIGWSLVIANIIAVINNIHFKNMFGGLAILGLFVGICALLFFTFKFIKWSWFTQKFPFLAISAQMFDGVNTFIITQYFGGWEKHPLPRYFIGNYGPVSFLFLKLAFVLPAVYLITKYVENKNAQNFLLFTIALFGFAQGLRNFITLILA